MTKVLKCFEIFSQPTGLFGKPNHLVNWVMFVGTAVWVLFFVCVGSWSFEVRIALNLFFWIYDYVRKVLQNFENFSQTVVSVRKPDLPIH